MSETTRENAPYVNCGCGCRGYLHPPRPVPATDDPLDRLRRAAEVYEARMAEYNAPGYEGLRMGFGAVRHELIEAALAVARAR